jgi:FtsP/CotA-like multicopper oxidase with cupredoxin domain
MMRRHNFRQFNRYLRRLVAAAMLLMAPGTHAIDVSGGITLGVMPMTKTLGGNDITFWVYCVMGSTEPGGCMNLQLPGPTLELGVGAQASVTLMPGMMATEPAPYDGHTIHFHGLDVP